VNKKHIDEIEKQMKLANEGLPEEERKFFADVIPTRVDPFNKYWEQFLNCARARSLWILAFGTGCGATELIHLMTARFDMARFGIFPRPTPRQASVFVVGGYASIKTIKRIIRSYEQMQGPKYVIALGSCTINGGMYYDSYNTINRLDYYIPVDVYIAGCMPRPEALIAGFNRLKEKITSGECDDMNDYVAKFDWYKRNQKEIIKDWNMPDYNW
jgi:NADH-quinone oxidoreductase subunit B